jgi:hypothetical protein
MENLETIKLNNVEYVRKDQLKTTPETLKNIVMIRTYSAGVHFGELVSREGKEVVLKNAHRVFYWTNACSLSQLAIQGSQNKNTENKISVAVPEIILTEAIEIIPMTKESFDNLTAIIWKK